MLISECSTLASISEELLTAQFPLRKGVRLIGVSISSLSPDSPEVDPQIGFSAINRVAQQQGGPVLT
jgi:hypothetical protein